MIIAEFWPEEIQALIRAMGQLLDDMGERGKSVCGAAKAEARIAYEPFAADDEKEGLMSLDEAHRIIEEVS
ncbi:MAG: hypothetical protein ACREDV_13705 [Methylocella sp.]